jgi:hypothetical protein
LTQVKKTAIWLIFNDFRDTSKAKSPYLCIENEIIKVIEKMKKVLDFIVRSAEQMGKNILFGGYEVA